MTVLPLLLSLFSLSVALPEGSAARPDPLPSSRVAAGTARPQDAALYHVMLLRAAPGRLLDLIDLLRRQREEGRAAGAASPFMLRHSQGDQWDLMLLAPAPEGQAMLPERRMMPPRADSLIAWREDLWVTGPGLEAVDDALDGAGYFHVEMFVALPGKRAELLKQRKMENAFLYGIERPENLIFVRAGGAAWDMFTLGAYRDLKHFAESADVPDELQERAALAAGFEGADRIGTYLRELIAYHHDTLATAVP